MYYFPEYQLSAVGIADATRANCSANSQRLLRGFGTWTSPCHLSYLVTLSAAARLAIALVVRAYFEKGTFMPIAALGASLFPRDTAAGSIDTFLDNPARRHYSRL
jgi:hypothetical protein